MKSQQPLQPGEDLVLLWKLVAAEAAARCGTSTTRDFKTVTTRVKHEGFSFLTITLANFGKDFERDLDQGYVDSSSYGGFHREKGLPRFLGGFLSLVFSRDSGVLLDEPSVDAIREIRQLTLMYSKILLPCSDARREAAYSQFIESEQDVSTFDTWLSPIDLEAFRRMSDMLFRDMFVEADREIYHNYTIPKHGPGATADKFRANEKYLQRTWPRRLQEEFPLELYLLPNPRYFEELAAIDILEPEDEIPVRVIDVPKTLKTPRIIGIEPVAMQYAQQSVKSILLDGIKRTFHLDSFLGFDDQGPNQLLAKEGSEIGNLATIDLSEASDRVSNQLVLEMMRRHGPLCRAVQACRSTKADVPGHGVIHLSKFASMGSALTFPIEAMVFFTIVLIGIERSLNTQLTKKDIVSLRGQVRIYGDDIIVPVEHVESVVDSLTRFGAKVNTRKSFWTGRFRESCGKEYYAGQDISIVKVRRVFPRRRRDVAEIQAIVAMRNLFYWRGYWATCRWLDDKIRAMLSHFPVVESSSPALGRESVLPFQADRINDSLHRPEVLAWVAKYRIPKIPLDGHGALLKWLLSQEQRLDEDESLSHLVEPALRDDHLERSGRPEAVRIKLGYVTPY